VRVAYLVGELVQRHGAAIRSTSLRFLADAEKFSERGGKGKAKRGGWVAVWRTGGWVRGGRIKEGGRWGGGREVAGRRERGGEARRRQRREERKAAPGGEVEEKGD
jgi:hypothetical protein